MIKHHLQLPAHVMKPNPQPTSPPERHRSVGKGARRLLMAVIAYCSVVSISVAAAATLASADLSLEALLSML
jgi:hypothetical protein